MRFGHRQANMVNDPGPAVFDLAKQIHGLSGVELQVFYKGTKLWDKETLSPYLNAAKQTGLAIPSLAGIWPPGVTLLFFNPPPKSTFARLFRRRNQRTRALYC